MFLWGNNIGDLPSVVAFSTIITLGSRLGVGRQTLNLLAEVRILAPQPSFFRSSLRPLKAHSSRGQGHRPLKAEIAGSNPACATKVMDYYGNFEPMAPSKKINAPSFS